MTTSNTTLVTHTFNNISIPQRESDGYLSATAMCKSVGKLFGHYKVNNQTKEFLKALEDDIGITISKLIQVIQGKGKQQGTWVHPKVAIHLAQWLSPDFAVQVTNWVFDWINEGMTPTQQCHAPLTENHQSKLSEAVDERVKQSGVSRGELLSKLRSHYEVSSWKKIHDSEYYNALALVRTWVFSNEELPSPATNNNVLQLSQLRDYAQNELGLPDLGYMDRKEAERLILSKANADNDDIDSKDRAGFITMRMEWIKALVMASEIGYKNISQKAKDDYALAVKSLAFDVHCAVNEMAKI